MVNIITSKVCITSSCFNFKHTIAKFKNRNIVCTTTTVKYTDSHILISLIKTICKWCCCRLIYDTTYIKSCNFSSLLSCLTLCIIKICRYCNYSLFNFLSKIIFSCLLHLLKNHSWQLLWSIFFITNNNARGIIITTLYLILYTFNFFCKIRIWFTNKTFNWGYCILRISYSLATSRVTNLSFTILCKTDYWRCCTFTFIVLNNFYFISLHYCNRRECSSKVYTYNLTHYYLYILLKVIFS